MKRRNLLILMGVFAALAAIAFLQTRQPQQPSPNETISMTFLGRELSMTVLDIQAVRLRAANSDQSFIISRDTAGNWTAPESEGSLDVEAASNIAKTVVLFPYQRTTPVDETTDLSQYGFQANPTLSIEIALTDGSAHAVAVGGLTPSGLQYYTLVDDLPQLYFIERGAVDYLLTLLASPPLT
jgi:hypothetical protein